MKTIPLTDAKAHLSDLVENVSQTHEVVSITKHGSPAAVLLSAEEFESLTETIAWMQEPEIRTDLAQARSDISSGETLSLAQLKKKLNRA